MLTSNAPKGAHPILGHAKSQFTDPRGEDYGRFIREIPNDGLIRLKGVFNTDQVLLTNAKGLAEVLVTRPYDFPKPERNRDILRLTIGDGLVTVEGAQHKKQRKHSLPSFAFRQIKGLYPLFWDKAVKMTQCIEAEVFAKQQAEIKADNSAAAAAAATADPDKPVSFGITDIEYWAPKATLDIIGVAGLGRDFNTLENSDDKLVPLYETLLSTTSDMAILIALHIVLGERLANILRPSASKRLAATTRELRALSEQFVREKKERMRQKDQSQSSSDPFSSKSHDADSKSTNSTSDDIDTLAGLIKAGVFTDHELVDQLLTIIAAGHETTSSAFTWTVYLLCIHPDMQTRLRQELYEALPPSRTANNSFDLASTLESLPLLNGVCSETLRVFPTVPVTVRTSKDDTMVLGGQHRLAAGTGIFISPWAINKDPAIWGPDAAEFKPERWIDPVTNKPNQTGGAASNYAFLTFLHGPRSCIGQNFARAELRALVAAFVVAFECSLADPELKIVPAGMVTTKPRGGLNVKLTRVQR